MDIVLCGGVGEHAAVLRARICAGMAWCGLLIDLGLNTAAVQPQPGQVLRISADGVSLPAYVVGVDEEAAIARETSPKVLNAER